MGVTIAWLLTAFNSRFHMSSCMQNGINNTVSQTQRTQKAMKTELVDPHSSEKLEGFTKKGTLIAHTTPLLQLAHMSSR